MPEHSAGMASSLHGIRVSLTAAQDSRHPKAQERVPKSRCTCWRVEWAARICVVVWCVEVGQGCDGQMYTAWAAGGKGAAHVEGGGLWLWFGRVNGAFVRVMSASCGVSVGYLTEVFRFT